MHGSAVFGLSRVPRRPCEAEIRVAGTDAPEQAAANPQLIRARFSLPAYRELFVVTMRQVVSQQDAGEQLASSTLSTIPGDYIPGTRGTIVARCDVASCA